MLRHIRGPSKDELKRRILTYLEDLNREPAIHTWTYRISEATAWRSFLGILRAPDRERLAAIISDRGTSTSSGRG